MPNRSPFSCLYNIPQCEHTIINAFLYQKVLGLFLVSALENDVGNVFALGFWRVSVSF